ncbi:MAG TPA: hypothetical protein VH083_23580 [Myxococcales bacterium]|nr:hypothetical protein [Myxococcales bacterium]
MNFLFSDGDLTPARKVLIVQSGSHELLGEAVALARRISPEAELSVLLRRGIGELPMELRSLPGVVYIENEGSRFDQVRSLRARGFDGVLVLFSNHPGFWKLKLLPFALGTRVVLGMNEHSGVFPVNLRSANRLGGHLLWRLRSGSNFASSADLLADIASVTAAPAKLGFLLAYERAANLRARLRGSRARWK